jgi:predicted dithiol-disulfide oxidoreductase (DUF899 family)
MTEHKTGTRKEWQAARKEQLELENEHAERGKELTQQRQELPWVRVEKEYAFETDQGTKTLAELFDGRPQLLAYHLMFGPGYTKGACPGCSGLADHFDGGVIHLNHRDVTFLSISRAPLEQLQAYKRRMGWGFPWVSSYESDFNFDFGFAFTEEQMTRDPFTQMIEEPPDWLEDWAEGVGAGLATGLAEGPGWNAFALSDGVVYHTYSRQAPDGDLLAPYYYQLLDQVPKGRGDEVRVRRHDEYGDS